MREFVPAADGESQDAGSRNLGPTLFYHPCVCRRWHQQREDDRDPARHQVHELSPVLLGEDSTQHLGGAVAVGEAAQDEALLLLVPMKLAPLNGSLKYNTRTNRLVRAPQFQNQKVY